MAWIHRGLLSHKARIALLGWDKFVLDPGTVAVAVVVAEKHQTAGSAIDHKSEQFAEDRVLQ